MRITGVTIVVFCAAGIAGSMGWIPTSIGPSDNPGPIELSAAPAQSGGAKAYVDLAQAPSESARATRCGECGVVESMREIVDPGEASNPVRCETRGNPAEGIAGSNQEEENIDTPQNGWRLAAVYRYGYRLERLAPSIAALRVGLSRSNLI